MVIASIEDLKAIESDVRDLKNKHSDAIADVQHFITAHRKCGYKAICKLLLEEATPEELKLK
jgi:hypothetical protein